MERGEERERRMGGLFDDDDDDNDDDGRTARNCDSKCSNQARGGR